MLDELGNILKEMFEAAMPTIVYSPYQTIVSEAIVTSSAGTFVTRQKAYSRLVHGRLEEDLKSALKKYSDNNLSEVFNTIREDLFGLIQGEMYFNLLKFPIELDLEDNKVRISQDGRIEVMPIRKIEHIELEIKIVKNEE